MPCSLSWILLALWSGEWDETALILYERGNKWNIFMKNRVNMIVLFPKTPFLSSKTSRKRSHLIHIHLLVFYFSFLQLAPCFFFSVWGIFFWIDLDLDTSQWKQFTLFWFHRLKDKTVEWFSFPEYK